MIRAYPLRSLLLVVTAVLLSLWIIYPLVSDLYTAALGWIYDEQRAFHQGLTESIGAFADKAGFSTGLAIVTGSFLYGVFHAAGPGHGKVILSTYLLSKPERVGKSVWLAVLSALVQGIVAILLVYGLFLVFGLVARDTKLAVAWSERLAFALVIVVGAHLVWRTIRGMDWFLRLTGKHGAHEHSHDHNHAHAHDHAHTHDHHDHAHHHHHHSHDENGVCSTCGHAHIPTSDQVEKARDLRSAIGIVLSIGMRPCSGAVLVLIFARFADISWIGVLAVLAMSAGTAITVSALAVLSVKARGLALNLLGSTSGVAGALSQAIAVTGGLVLIAMGYGLLINSFDAPVRSMGL